MIEELKSKVKLSKLYARYSWGREKRAKASAPGGNQERPVWAFNAGDTFTGNPKWLFLYVCKYRPDIRAYWICDSMDTVRYVRSLGYEAWQFGTNESILIQSSTSVFVVEQVKEIIPVNMPNVVLLNLYHGVGCKTVEKKVRTGFLAERIAAKYIRHNAWYQEHMLFLVTSELMEDHFTKQMDLSAAHLIRAGYPRCIYQKYYEKVHTFDHNLLTAKDLPEDTRIAAWVPTYRDDPGFDFWSAALPDPRKLADRLSDTGTLLIFKVHPQMEKDPRYIWLKETYADHPYFWFWDNRQDFYEIMDRIDLAIIDYSSIFYDLLSAGVKHFIRYFFDYDNPGNRRGFVFDLKEMTCGAVCESFEDLLLSLDCEQDPADEAETKRLLDLFWSYSDKDSMDRIVDAALSFVPKLEEPLKTLYSFDIFDTLIARKVLDPAGIFYGVQDKIRASAEAFPGSLTNRYPQIRQYCEKNVREFYAKRASSMGSRDREISFESIFERMAELYALTPEQTRLLMDWEKELEYENCIPRPQEIALAEELAARGETVILVSDMYLDADFIRSLLKKASPALASLPMFLSSDLGMQKSTRALYLQAYLSFDNYNFGRWIHYGDHPKADGEQAKAMGIEPRLHAIPSFNAYEQALITRIGTYDAYLTAAMMARMRQTDLSDTQYFAYAYASLYLVPYVDWVIDDALARGYRTLYFISRDGHHLREIADALITQRGLDLKTRYIYGSRKAWRIPSFITEPDEDFFTSYGNLGGVNSYPALLQALLLSDEDFRRFFPSLDSLRTKKVITSAERDEAAELFKVSPQYRAYILSLAAQRRPIVARYLAQEMDLDEPFACVEYWGRGYTQQCHTRLVQYVAGMEDAAAADGAGAGSVDADAAGTAAGSAGADAAGTHEGAPAMRQMDVPYYYVRSIYPSDGHNVRHNFSPNNTPLIFAEALFANIPYKTVEAYAGKDGKIVPVIEPQECNMELEEAMSLLLPFFAKDFAAHHFMDKKQLRRDLYDFSLYYLTSCPGDPLFASTLGNLQDSVTLYGKFRPFAPEVTEEMITSLQQGLSAASQTSSIEITLARSSEEMTRRFLHETVEVPAAKKAHSQRWHRDVELTELNMRSFRSLDTRRRDAARLQARYNALTEKISSPKAVLVLGITREEAREVLGTLPERLVQAGLKAPVFAALEKPYEKALSKVAACALIITDEPHPLFSLLKLRPETRLLRIRRHAVPLRSPSPFGDLEAVPQTALDLYQAEHTNPFSICPISGPEGETADGKSLPGGLPPASVLRCGMPATDVYFDSGYRGQAVSALQKAFPQVRGRRVIFYRPRHTWQSEVWDPAAREDTGLPNLQNPTASEDVERYYRSKRPLREVPRLRHLDIRVLYKLLGDSYAVVLCSAAPCPEDGYHVPDDLRDFAMDLRGVMTPRQLAVAADILVGDETEFFLECALLKKPMFLMRGGEPDSSLLIPKEDLETLPSAGSVWELAAKIKALKEYDDSPRASFAQKYLSYCSGEACLKLAQALDR